MKFSNDRLGELKYGYLNMLLTKQTAFRVRWQHLTRIVAFCMLFSVFVLEVRGQQQSMYTQYMFNGLALNPAFAGSHGSISATALSRFQWVGFEGAPVTHTFSMHSPVPDKNIGLGVVFSHEQIGISQQNTFFASYAYQVRFLGSTLSMGIQGGLKNSKVDYTELGVSDPNLQSSISSIVPNFGVGVYWYGDRYYVGASIPTALKNNWKNSNPGSEVIISTEVPHFFLTGGLVFDIAPLVKLKPSLLLKSVIGAPMEVDLNANVILDDKIWLGVSYRSLDAWSVLLDLQITNQLKFGYAYDITVTDIRMVSGGSHEIMLNYRLIFDKARVVTPRYF